MSKATAKLAELFSGTPEELRRRALTHSSWVETRSHSYGRLAFLGDSVLGLSVASELFERFTDADIGDLTKVHNQAVSQRACVSVAAELGVAEELGEAAEENIGLDVKLLSSSERTLASIVESIIGACYLTHGYEETAEAVVEAFTDQIEFATRTRLDFKSELQEVLAQTGSTVSYEVLREVGPPHERRFEVAAQVKGESLGTGTGRSKKEAEQAAADKALEKLKS